MGAYSASIASLKRKGYRDIVGEAEGNDVVLACLGDDSRPLEFIGVLARPVDKPGETLVSWVGGLPDLWDEKYADMTDESILAAIAQEQAEEAEDTSSATTVAPEVPLEEGVSMGKQIGKFSKKALKRQAKRENKSVNKEEKAIREGMFEAATTFARTAIEYKPVKGKADIYVGHVTGLGDGKFGFMTEEYEGETSLNLFYGSVKSMAYDTDDTEVPEKPENYGDVTGYFVIPTNDELLKAGGQWVPGTKGMKDDYLVVLTI